MRDLGFGTLRFMDHTSLARYLSTLLPFIYLEFSLLKPNIRKKGTLIVKGLLGNLDCSCSLGLACPHKATHEIPYAS